MRFLRKSVLLTLVLVSALVISGSPAFATPNITSSSGATPVTPFFTPSTNTRSQYTGRSVNARFRIPVFGDVTCAMAEISAYASTTHTQLRLTLVSFRNCVSAFGGATVDGGGFTCQATSDNPWFLHARVTDGRSTMTTINLTSACFIIITLNDARRSSCIARLDAVVGSHPRIHLWRHHSTSTERCPSHSSAAAVRYRRCQ